MTDGIAVTSSVPSNTVKEEEKEVIKPPFSSFKDKQANLLAVSQFYSNSYSDNEFSSLSLLIFHL